MLRIILLSVLFGNPPIISAEKEIINHYFQHYAIIDSTAWIKTTLKDLNCETAQTANSFKKARHAQTPDSWVYVIAEDIQINDGIVTFDNHEHVEDILTIAGLKDNKMVCCYDLSHERKGREPYCFDPSEIHRCLTDVIDIPFETFVKNAKRNMFLRHKPKRILYQYWSPVSGYISAIETIAGQGYTYIVDVFGSFSGMLSYIDNDHIWTYCVEDGRTYSWDDACKKYQEKLPSYKGPVRIIIL